jgi:hypothetical protein
VYYQPAISSSSNIGIIYGFTRYFCISTRSVHAFTSVSRSGGGITFIGTIRFNAHNLSSLSNNIDVEYHHNNREEEREGQRWEEEGGGE